MSYVLSLLKENLRKIDDGYMFDLFGVSVKLIIPLSLDDGVFETLHTRAYIQYVNHNDDQEVTEECVLEVMAGNGKAEAITIIRADWEDRR
jgi:hypothetical protein